MSRTLLKSPFTFALNIRPLRQATRLLRLVLAASLLAPHPSPLTAQGWQQHFEFNSYDFAKAALPTPDGGFIVAGHTGASADLHDGFLLKLDPEGREQWRVLLGGALYEEVNDLALTADGGFILAGSAFNPNGDADAWLVKTNRFGEVEWQQAYGGAAFEFARAVVQTSDGGFAFTGRRDDGADVGIFLVKTDPLGAEQWSNTYGGVDDDEGRDLMETPDSQLVLVGTTASLGAGGSDFYAAKVSLGGAFQWFNTFGGAGEDLGFSVTGAPDGGLLFGGATQSFGAGSFDAFVVKASAGGIQQWTKTYGGALGEWGASLLAVPDGGFALAGSLQNPQDTLDDIFLLRADAAGSQLWLRTFGEERRDVPHALAQNADGGFLLAGHSRTDNPDSTILTSQAYLLRTSPEGATLTNYLQGRVFFDENLNCLPDPGEPGAAGHWLRAAFPGKTFYGITDAGGNYSILTDTGSCVLQLVSPNDYWLPCENSVLLVFANSYDTLVADFPIQAALSCPDLDADVATSIVRPCSTATYQVRFCNLGTATATDAFVEVTLDSFQTFVSAGLPVASQSGNTFRFDLGDVAAGACGGFPVEALLACDVLLGRTHCIEAHIFPDSICLPPDPLWDGASVALAARCVGDSVFFTIKNKGAGGMDEPLKSIIVEDQIVGRALNFQLGAGDSLVVAHGAFGKTLRMEAEQSPGHPGRSLPAVTVEGCSTSGVFSTGFHTMFPEDDADPFVSKDCRESAASLPPDAKLAFPKGADSLHLIEPQTDIEYLIHFQNTGGDTVSTVVIQDTLSPWLDAASVRPGAASHPFSLAVSNLGVLQFTLDSLSLPDSASNEPASHGFVKFRVSQLPGVPFDSLITNRSSVSFDFGAAAAHPAAFHTLDKPQVFSIADVGLCSGGAYNGVAVLGDTSFFELIELPDRDSVAWVNADVGEFGAWSQVDTAVLLGEPLNGWLFESDTSFTEVFPMANGCDSVVAWTVDVLTADGERQAADDGWRVFPNPVSDWLFLEASDPAEEVLAVEAMDSAGRRTAVFFKKTSPQTLALDARNWQAGVWLVLVKTTGGVAVAKVVKR